MYIDKNKPGVFFRSFHRFLCVLSASTVLFSVSGCNGTMKTDKGNEPAALKVESQPPVETETLPVDYLSTEISSDDSTTTEIPSYDSSATENPSDELPGYTVTQAEINLDTLERLNSTYGVNIRYGSAVS